MITKHYCKSIVRAALLLASTMCIIGLAPAFSTSARADYSINDVSGVYVWDGDGWDVGQATPDNHLPLSGVGLVTYTAETGTCHDDVFLTVDATKSLNLHVGIYT